MSREIKAGLLLPRQKQRELRDRFESLDPFALKQGVEKRLKPILGSAEVARRPSGGSPQGD